MYRGSVVSIHVARCAGEPMIGVDHTRAVAGRGLEGDRYYERAGFYSDDPGPIRTVSLIEEETIEACDAITTSRWPPGSPTVTSRPAGCP